MYGSASHFFQHGQRKMASASYDFWRLGASQAVAVDSAGGATASSAVFGPQTYGIKVSYSGSTSATAGVRVKIVSPSDTPVSSTQDFLLPPIWVEPIAVSPGQRASVISNDAGKPSLSIVELTK